MGNICHQAIFYPVVLMKAELFDLNYCIFADYVFNLKAWKIYRFKYISQIVCFYDFGGISTVNKDKDYNFRKVKRNLIIDSCGHINYIIGVIYRFLLSTKALIKIYRIVLYIYIKMNHFFVILFSLFCILEYSRWIVFIGMV